MKRIIGLVVLVAALAITATALASPSPISGRQPGSRGRAGLANLGPAPVGGWHPFSDVARPSRFEAVLRLPNRCSPGQATSPPPAGCSSRRWTGSAA